MSTATTQRLPLAVAQRLADKIAHALEPACERIEVVGSIRRRTPTAGDIELLLIPREDHDLFGEPSGRAELDAVLFDLRRSRKLEVPIRSGPKWKTYPVGAWPGINLDLFIVTPDTWGVQMLIRTGPAAFAKRCVTSKRQGGWMPQLMRIQGGRVLVAPSAEDRRAGILRGPNSSTALHTPEECDVFEALGLGYVEPEDRRG